MSEKIRIIDIASWSRTPLGEVALDWEQQCLDLLLDDVFGFHALQVGWPVLDGLRSNRMPHRWLLTDGDEAPGSADADPSDAKPGGHAAAPARRTVSLMADFDALPFPADSLDLVVLPHTLELCDDAHQTLREVERVLRPEGRVVVIGFNPWSLWGLGQFWSELTHRLGVAGRRAAPSPLPVDGELIGPRRLRDWLKLLGFEVEAPRYGCYRPLVHSQVWLDRWAGLERLGERWWTPLGGAYAVVAVKRVHGMRLVGPVRRRQLRRRVAPVTAASARTRVRDVDLDRLG